MTEGLTTLMAPELLANAHSIMNGRSIVAEKIASKIGLGCFAAFALAVSGADGLAALGPQCPVAHRLWFLVV